MRRAYFGQTLLLLLCAAVVLPTLTLAPAFAVTATKMRFTTETVGPVEVTTGPGGRMRLIFTYGTIVLTEDHRYFGFNDDSKTFVEYHSGSQFLHSQFYKSFGLKEQTDKKYRITPWQWLKNTKVRELPASEFRREVYVPGKHGEELWKVEDVVGTKAFGLPADWVDAIAKCAGAPSPKDVFPLDSDSYYDGSKQPVHRLHCVNVCKVNVADSYFSLPKGYKKARDDVEVFVGGSSFDKLFYRDYKE